MIGLLAWVLIRPPVALAAVFLMFALEQWSQFSEPFFLQHQAYMNYFVGLLVVLALTRSFVAGRNPLRGQPRTALPIVLLFLFALASTAWTLAPDDASRYWHAQWPYVITILLLAPFLARSEKDFVQVLIALLSFGTLLVGLLLVLGKWENRMLVLSTGAQPLSGNPLAVAELCGFVLLAAVFFRPRRMGWTWSLLRWGIVLLCLALIVRSGSRGELLGAVAAAALTWPLARRIGNPASLLGWGLAVAVLLVGTLWAVQNFGEGNIRWSQSRIDADVTGRFRNTVRVLEAWSESSDPFFGMGNSSSFAVIGGYPHDVPVEILCEEGIFGLLLFATALGSAYKSVRFVRRHSEVGSRTRSVLGFLVACAVFDFTLTLKQGNLLGSLNLFMLLMLLGRLERGHAATLLPDSTQELAAAAPGYAESEQPA